MDGHVTVAVYRLYDSSGALLYVGITRRQSGRFAEHARDKPWWPEVARKTVDWCAGRREAEQAEVAAIARERPRYNIAPGIYASDSPSGLEVSLPAHEHALTPHGHATPWCSGRYWCAACRTWLTGPPCTGTRLAHPA